MGTMRAVVLNFERKLMEDISEYILIISFLSENKVEHIPMAVVHSLTPARLPLFRQVPWELCHVRQSFSSYRQKVRDRDR